MQLILIGNYPPDRQESMERFALMLSYGFKQSGSEVEIWRPTVFFGSWSNSTSVGVGKWLGYLDKWVVFPCILLWRIKKRPSKFANTRFHICDHSNAYYLKYLPVTRTCITCHDVLAIRGAFGFSDAHCPATRMGKVLQRWILSHLSSAKSIACVSSFTLNQLKELSGKGSNTQANWRIIHNALNAEFKPLLQEQAKVFVQRAGIGLTKPFLLHVGSALPRKNRKMLLDIVIELGNRWSGQICYAGEAVEEELKVYAAKLGIGERVISVEKPDHRTLLALYNTCEAFIFPSFSEGFGWPLIEAQACGAPVIASNINVVQEVSGGTSLLADPNDPAMFADAFLYLQDKHIRAEIIRNGFGNTLRFSLTQMMEGYLDLHGLKSHKLTQNAY